LDIKYQLPSPVLWGEGEDEASTSSTFKKIADRKPASYDDNREEFFMD